MGLTEHLLCAKCGELADGWKCAICGSVGPACANAPPAALSATAETMPQRTAGARADRKMLRR